MVQQRNSFALTLLAISLFASADLVAQKKEKTDPCKTNQVAKVEVFGAAEEVDACKLLESVTAARVSRSSYKVFRIVNDARMGDINQQQLAKSITRATGAKTEFANRAAEESLEALKSGELKSASFVGTAAGGLVAGYEFYKAWQRNEETAPR